MTGWYLRGDFGTRSGLHIPVRETLDDLESLLPLIVTDQAILVKGDGRIASDVEGASFLFTDIIPVFRREIPLVVTADLLQLRAGMWTYGN